MMPSATMIQGGASLANSGAGWMLEKYGWSDQAPKYRYGLTGTSKQKGGLVSGAYTDVEKQIMEPGGRKKSKDHDFLETMKWVSDIGNAITSGSSSSMEAGFKKEEEKNNAVRAGKSMANAQQDMGLINPQGQINDSILDPTHTPMGNGNLASSQDLGTTGFDKLLGQKIPNASMPSDQITPSQIDNLTPNTEQTPGFDKLMGGSSSLINPFVPQDNIPQAGLTLESGGKNKGKAVPIEAEGGEYQVSWDDDYQINDIHPISGPSHSKGGVDLKLGKNKAILNKEQYAALQAGTPLKDILSSLPNVNNVTTAQKGVKRKPDPIDKVFDWIGNASDKSSEWLLKSASGEPDSPKPIMVGPNQSYDSKTGRKTSLIQPHQFDYEAASKKGIEELKYAAAHPYEQPEDTQVDNSPINPVPESERPAFGNYEDYKSTMFGEGYPDAPLPEKGFGLIDAYNSWQSGTGGSSSTKTPPPEKPPRWQWGASENAAVANAGANLITMLQPRPKPVRVGIAPTPEPVMVTPRAVNPKSTFNEINKQLVTEMDRLTQTGHPEQIPALVASSLDATNKVGEQFAQINQQGENQAFAANAASSNQLNAQGQQVAQDAIKQNAILELERLKVEGSQDTERMKALQNLIYGPVAYDREKYNRAMQDATLAAIRSKTTWEQAHS